MEPNRRRGQSFIDDDDARDMSVTSCSGDGGPELPSFDPNMTFDDETNKDSDDFDESNEEEYFSRGRSRSRSVHENDDKVKTLTDQELKAQVAKAKDHPTERPKVEKTGPLQGREVAILQQGLQEATNQRREEERLEEQAELEAAMREKEQRSMSSNPGQGSPLVQIGTDPHMRRVKILLLGDSNVGKTSIIARLTTGDFKTKMVQTVGVDYKPKKVNIGGENIQVQLWDTAGSEKFRQITTSYYRGVNGIMLCFDVSQRETYERVADWLQNIKKHASENVHVMLVGNKIDLRAERGNDPNCVHEREVKPIANKYGITYAETSALTSDNVEGALLSFVREILQVETESPGASGTRIRKSVDSFMKRASASLDRNGAGGNAKEEKEKCAVS